MTFVAMDAKPSRIYFGHRINGKWIIDSNLGKAIISGLDYKLEISLRGGTVSATVNGTAVANYTYASTVVDGAFGLLTRRGANADDLVISPTAGHGWDVIDPVDVLSHELGHAMGLDHDAADEFGVMAPTRSANATTYWIPVSIALPPVVTTVAPMPSRGAVASVAAERPPHSRMTVSAITPVA